MVFLLCTAMCWARWADVRPLPGARRLLEHLHSCGARVAVATSTSRATFQKKLAKKPWLTALFQAAVCGDEVLEQNARFSRRCCRCCTCNSPGVEV